MTHIRSRILAIFMLGALASPAMAKNSGIPVDDIVRFCASQANVTGTYQVHTLRQGGAVAISVIPGDGVSEKKAASVNACIARATATAPTAVRVGRSGPATTQACLAEYRLKMRATNNGREYRGGGFTGLLGRHGGRILLEREYDRCLNRISYARNRCPNGVFQNGAGYCIRRPYR